MNAGRTQRDRILSVLLEAGHEWVPLPKILELGIAQFGARIKEARALGFQIENRTEMVDGKKHSWYRLVPSADVKPGAPRVLQAEGDGVLFAPDTTRVQTLMLAHEIGRRGAR